MGGDINLKDNIYEDAPTSASGLLSESATLVRTGSQTERPAPVKTIIKEPERGDTTAPIQVVAGTGSLLSSVLSRAGFSQNSLRPGTAETPGSYTIAPAGQLGSQYIGWRGVESNWAPVDPRGGRPSDQVPARPSDQPVNGVLQLAYGDPNFDRKLSAGNYETLKITGLPQGEAVSPWVDNKGYFFWFKSGSDNRAHHYIPAGVKNIEVNGVRQNMDELRIQASQAYMSEQDGIKNGFASLDAKAHPYEYARRMAAVSQQALDLQERTLRQAADASPNNPYFRIYLADTILASAFKPVIEGISNNPNQPVNFDNPYTLAKVDQALSELKKAEGVARQQGNLYGPNTEMMPMLSPFALNPYYYNPDMYWGGALYQAYQREVGLTMMKAWIKSGMLKIELPPALPGR